MPAARRRYKNLADRILSNTLKVGECYVWQLATSEDGYGVITLRVKGLKHPVKFFVHRVAYHLFKGPIPQGMTLDHLIEQGPCTSKACWRPEHLQPVTRAVNSSNRWKCSPLKLRHIQFHGQIPLIDTGSVAG